MEITFYVNDVKTSNELNKNEYQFKGYMYNGELYDDLETIYEVIEEEIGGNYNNIDPQDTAEFEDCCDNIEEVWESVDVATRIVREYVKNRKGEK